MKGDLDELKAAMTKATPVPDKTRKAADLALAQKNFADLQGSLDPARLKSDRPASGFWTGVRQMFAMTTTKGGMVATTALIAVGFVALTPLGQEMLSPRDVTDVLVRQKVQPPAPSIAVEPLAPTSLPAPEVEVEIAPDAVALPSITQSAAPSRSDDAAALIGGTIVGGVVQGTAQRSNAAPRRLVQRPRAATGDVFVARPQSLSQEEFSNAAPNPLRVTSDMPVSTFSIDVDTASYAVVRNTIMAGRLPTRDAVRIEEMINYFPYDYAAPDKGDAFQPSVSVSQTPWNTGTQLVHIGIQGALPDLEDRPPLNLVFLIDTSGSMKQANKLPLLKQSFALMLDQLRPEDEVAIVTYAGSAGQALAPTKASNKQAILSALDRLSAGGSTAGEAGLQQAYALADQMTEDGDVSRVILATDGDFNVGLTSPTALKDYIAHKRDTGAYLSVIGFGRGNLDDATMQALAQNGNGTATYIDTLNEAQKVLVDQLSGALFPIANDVKIQVEFNPGTVSEYRLIGYETRILRREDFNNDRVDAGDIGAGHQVTALYEITPVGSSAQLVDSLRYGEKVRVDRSSEELGFLRLRFKAPGASESRLIETPITPDLKPHPDAGFAFAIAGFGQLLRNAEYLGDWGWNDAIALANANRGEDAFGYRAEAVQLMRLAHSLSSR